MLNKYVAIMIPPEKSLLREYFEESFLLKACVIALAFLAFIFAPHEASAAGFGAQEQATTQQTDQRDASSEIAVPLPKGKKLILADGTFQMVREYHREGDRVRYYSLERSAWEEMPAMLVDWAATEKAEVEQSAHQEKLAKQIAES
jgi:hypothetical protein